VKKIITAIDGLKYSSTTTDYAIHLSQLIGAHLVGVFLDDPTYHSYKIYELLQNEGGISEEKIERFELQDSQTRQRASNQFQTACTRGGIEFSLHHDRSIAIRELIHESIFADLLIISSRETLTHYEEEAPTHFLREVLAGVECPVLVVPDRFEPIQKMTLLYDGEPSSVFAIKLFSYLFPPLMELQTEVLTVNAAIDHAHLPDNRLMREFMKRHFPWATYTILQGYPESEIIRHLEYRPASEMVVLGAHRRPVVSRWFKPLMSHELIRDLRSPLFIAPTK
jgi:nucleotide-binding universal stress UspA family protein